MGNSKVEALGASEGLHLAHVTISDTVGTANWFPVPQTCLVADLRLPQVNGLAFSGISHSNAALFQAGCGVEFAGVSVSLSVGTTDWLIVPQTSQVAHWDWNLNTSSGIGDLNGSLSHAVH